MKTAFVMILAAGAFGLSMASAAEMSQPEQHAPIHAYIACDSPYLGNSQECISQDNTCPPSYEASGTNYCINNLHPDLQACGTVCKSIYNGN